MDLANISIETKLRENIEIFAFHFWIKQKLSYLKFYLGFSFLSFIINFFIKLFLGILVNIEKFNFSFGL